MRADLGAVELEDEVREAVDDARLPVEPSAATIYAHLLSDAQLDLAADAFEVLHAAQTMTNQMTRAADPA